MHTPRALHPILIRAALGVAARSMRRLVAPNEPSRLRRQAGQPLATSHRWASGLWDGQQGRGAGERPDRLCLSNCASCTHVGGALDSGTDALFTGGRAAMPPSCEAADRAVRPVGLPCKVKGRHVLAVVFPLFASHRAGVGRCVELMRFASTDQGDRTGGRLAWAQRMLCW